jgi:hypothetical protein
MSGHTFITNSTVLRPQWALRHTGHAESLAVQPSFGSEVLNNLSTGFNRINEVDFYVQKETYRFKLGIATRFRGGSWVQSNRAEEVIHTQSQGECKE